MSASPVLLESLWRSTRRGVGAALGLDAGAPAAGPAALSRLIGLVAILAVPVAIAVAATHELLYNASPWQVWLLAWAVPVALLARRRIPVTVFAICLVAVLALTATGVDSVAGFGILLALYTVAAHRDIRIALAAAVLLEGGVVLVALRFAPAGSVDDALVFLTGLSLGALFLGTTFRANRRLLAETEDRARRLEREKRREAELAAAAERTRIAREMHDIVAHGLAVVITLSEGAAAAVRRDPDAARAAMTDAAGAGRRSLNETRRLLRVLRSDEAPDTAPQPDLAALPTLVGSAERAGVSVTLELDPDCSDLGGGVQAALYRIVQEAITNVLRHGVDSRSILIRVARIDGGVEFEIEDDGRHATGRDTSLGAGLAGMRERAALFGGDLTAGPSSRGWRVAGHLAET